MDDIEMVTVRGGSLLLRDTRRKRQWEVELETYDIGAFAVTEEQVAELIGVPVERPRRPAVAVSWTRAIRICNAASEWEGLDPAYTFDGEDVTWHVDSDGYRLPTEAEWEWACRAGSKNAQYGPLGDIAWTAADGIAGPQDVGGKLPNLNGMFDTLGNTWEWCWDLLDPAVAGEQRVIRGGGFADGPMNVGASVRRGASPRSTHDDVGFRFARGGFDSVAEAQGWSAARDRDRAFGG